MSNVYFLSTDLDFCFIKSSSIKLVFNALSYARISIPKEFRLGITFRNAMTFLTYFQVSQIFMSRLSPQKGV